MRDDLHRTPALLRLWRTAVRHAAREADADCVPRDLSRGATQLLDAGLRPEWLRGLRDALGADHGQLFPESRVDTLRKLEDTPRHPIERRVLEASRAVCLRTPDALGVVDAAIAAVHRHLVDAGIEHCAAVIRAERNAFQASELRRSMVKHRDACSLELGRQSPPRKLKGMDLLNLEVSAP